MAEALDLKPCPFCGQQPTVTEAYVETGAGDGARHFKIECTRHPDMKIVTGALGPHGYRRPDDLPSDDAARERARAAWNRRSEPEALRLLGEAEKALEPFAGAIERRDVWEAMFVVRKDTFPLNLKHFRQAKAALDKIRKGRHP